MIINETNPPTFIIISGATATGKTDLSIQLAEYFNTCILSFDSRQFYKELNIGTAKPNTRQLASVEHFFIGHQSIHEEYNANSFSLEARNFIRLWLEKWNHLKPMILVGGSGLYLQALLYEFDPIPSVDSTLREELRLNMQKFGITYLQNLLKDKDPLYFGQVDLRNPQRIMRALEVSLGTGMPYSSFRNSKRSALQGRIFKFCLHKSRTLLYQDIEARVDDMIQEGLEDEVRSLIPFQHLNPLKTVGYSEFFDYFEGKQDHKETLEKIKQHTRNYAKRQITWFKKDKENTWLTDYTCHQAFEKIIQMVQK